MADSERRERGKKKLNEVYAGTVPIPEPGQSTFADLMLEQLFAEVWTRPELSMRDRRLLLLGIIAEKGEAMTFGIQAKAALKNGELSASERLDAALKGVLAEGKSLTGDIGGNATTQEFVAALIAAL